MSQKMRLLTATACLLIFSTGLASAAPNPSGTGQPSQSCQATNPPAFPGSTGSSPGSAFAGTAGAVYANPGTSQLHSNNPKSVAQYDVACFQQSQRLP
jgi:hypothetical protein